VDRLCQLPFMFIHPSKLGWLFLLKAIVTPIVCLGTLIWVRPGRLSLPSSHFRPRSSFCVPLQAVKMAGSEAASALSNPGDRAPGGTARFYAFMFLVTSTQGTWATMSCNIGDFSRFVCRLPFFFPFRRSTFASKLTIPRRRPRYCKKPSAAYVQMLAIPMLLGTISIFGAISAACCYAVYGVNLFQPYEMIVSWRAGKAGRRANGDASWWLVGWERTV
jgi:NCS1 family nucleobase:cation symporter-1